MKIIFSSETSVDFQGTARRYIPEDSTFYFNGDFEKNYEWHPTLG
jgi:hypothetical protein